MSEVSYQLLLRTPGIIPCNDSSRKHTRQMPNFRRNARERPQRWQRLCCRTANFGFRLLFSIMALRAIGHSLLEKVKDVRRVPAKGGRVASGVGRSPTVHRFATI